MRLLDDHLTTCEYALVQCKNECTKNKEVVQLLRHDLDNHLKNDCPNREYTCPRCKYIGRYCDITSTHFDTCPKVIIPCPNTDCKASVPRCDLSAHRSTYEFEKVPCKYAGIGCEEELLRKDLQQHEMDDALLHLHLTIKTVSELQKKMKLIGDNVATCPCVFKMPQYHQHKSSKQEWYSPPFYTHPRGYKICLGVDANGYDNDTHVSVYTYLMKGKNDDNLPWPFTGKVTITLLNQLEDENYHTCKTSFSQDNEASRRVVDREMATTGYGKQLFIPHNKLDYDEDFDKVQYLKDDCLYFQIKAKTPEPVKPWLTCTL